MKLVSFSVTNYRSITKAHKISLGQYTVLLGKNNEGKSNIEKNWDRNNHGSIIIISANATGVCGGRK